MNLEEEVKAILENLNDAGFKNKIGLTTKELAQFLGVSIPFLELNRRQATGIPYIKIGRKVIYTKRAISEHIVSQFVKTL